MNTGVPISEFKKGIHVGAQCKYCHSDATTVYAAGSESMAFCDDCKPGRAYDAEEIAMMDRYAAENEGEL